MKNIVFAMMLMFTSGIIFACNKSSGSDSDTGYVDPGNWGGITVNANKAYDLNNANFGTCGPLATCLAIIYQGELNDSDYVGIAVKNGIHTLKIYWEASSIPSSYTSTCTVNLDGTSTTETINVTITGPTNGTYTITFVNAIASVGINAGDSITALKI